MPSFNPAKPKWCRETLKGSSLNCSRLCAFSQSQRVGPTFCSCLWPIYKDLHSLSAGAYLGSQTWEVGKACRALEWLWASWKGGPLVLSLKQLWAASWWHPQSRLVRSMVLWWLLSPGGCVPSPSQPFSYAHCLSTPGGERKKWVFWAASCLAGEAGHSFTVFSLSPWEKSQAKGICLGTELWCFGDGVAGIKWNFIFFSSYHPRCIYS